jgi:hypothetical protein
VFDLCKKLDIDTIYVNPSMLVNDTTLAQFDSDNNRVLVNENFAELAKDRNTTLEQVLLHEYIHVISSYAIDNVDVMPEKV